MKRKKPVFKIGPIYFYALDRRQRKTLEFWMAVIRTIAGFFAIPAGIYALYKLFGG